jgi:hypothetical protein
MRPTGTITQECLAPMYVWERIDVGCVVFLRHGSLLVRRMSGIIYFLVVR